MASSPSSALLETLIHLELTEGLLPDDYQLLKIEAPDSVGTEQIRAAELPAGWEHDLPVTRAVGDNWLRFAKTPLLEVPSAIVPETAHYVLNPEHAEARDFRIVWTRRFPYDKRLFKGPS